MWLPLALATTLSRRSSLAMFWSYCPRTSEVRRLSLNVSVTSLLEGSSASGVVVAEPSWWRGCCSTGESPSRMERRAVEVRSGDFMRPVAPQQECFRHSPRLTGRSTSSGRPIGRRRVAPFRSDSTVPRHARPGGRAFSPRSARHDAPACRTARRSGAPTVARLKAWRWSSSRAWRRARRSRRMASSIWSASSAPGVPGRGEYLNE